MEGVYGDTGICSGVGWTLTYGDGDSAYIDLADGLSFDMAIGRSEGTGTMICMGGREHLVS